MDRADETIDPLGLTDLRLIQPKKGYRFSIDPVLLCAFVPSIKNTRVVDLGTGNGIIPLLLSARKEAQSIIGVELQPAMVERARRSVKLNGLEGVIRILPGDVRALPEGLLAGGYDVVTANPPYRTQETGRIAPEDERAMARHELSGGLYDFLSAAVSLLKPGGRFYVVYLAERVAELLSEMHSCRLQPKRLRMVHSREGVSARMVLVEGSKDGKPGMVVEAPLIIYTGEGRVYSEEVLAMYEGKVAQSRKRTIKSL